MIRYWIEFNLEDYILIPFGAKIGCGVTAFNYEDALNIINKELFDGNPMPPIKSFVENIDISTLDSNHVLLNMGPPNFRGIWFPLGYN